MGNEQGKAASGPSGQEQSPRPSQQPSAERAEAAGAGAGASPAAPAPAGAPAAAALSLVVLGASRVGKTSLIARLCGARFDAACPPTLAPTRSKFAWKHGGAAVGVAALEVPDDDEDLPASAARARPSYEHAALVCILFDLRRAATWKAAEGLVWGVPAHIPILLLANCMDAVAEGSRCLSLEALQAFCGEASRRRKVRRSRSAAMIATVPPRQLKNSAAPIRMPAAAASSPARMLSLWA